MLVVSTACLTPSPRKRSDYDGNGNGRYWKEQSKTCGRNPTYGVSFAVYELYLLFGIWIVIDGLRFRGQFSGVLQESDVGANTNTVVPESKPTPPEVENVEIN